MCVHVHAIVYVFDETYNFILNLVSADVVGCVCVSTKSDFYMFDASVLCFLF